MLATCMKYEGKHYHAPPTIPLPECHPYKVRILILKYTGVDLAAPLYARSP